MTTGTEPMLLEERKCTCHMSDMSECPLHPRVVIRTTETLSLVRVEPQPSYIESSGRWCWPLPEHARFPGCCTEVVTASREWWEYAPSQAKPHPYAEGVHLRDNVWYWAVPTNELLAALTRLIGTPKYWDDLHHEAGCGCVIHEARAAVCKAMGVES